MTTAEIDRIKEAFARADAARDPMHLIHRNLYGRGIDLYIGNKQAASDPAYLAEHGVGTVVNCAVNLDINMVTNVDPETRNLPFGWSPVRYYKLGIVDGPGNPAPMLLAGYYQLKGLIDQTFPQKPSYPWQGTGNILVNCRGGRSRSVTLVALFLHLECPSDYPTLQAAIDHIRVARQLHPDEWPQAPKQVLVDAAQWSADMVAMIRPFEPATITEGE
ncbi:dual specificity protein phosphatase family protein [Donghicola sp. C2-DW-16]|uniref:Dual specificity protein phosphatase family protein n=1 Tax=Donghicola mangrovi TaxID=2729614 RepID=A0ABX2PCR7_9RHOB|nr:dual specificity protein phosphatase [Donghicola mangrovi]NVO27264.1 dual specificity protein phosphatase family protein [Donghicola mangrovi]